MTSILRPVCRAPAPYSSQKNSANKPSRGPSACHRCEVLLNRLAGVQSTSSGNRKTTQAGQCLAWPRVEAHRRLQTLERLCAACGRRRHTETAAQKRRRRDRTLDQRLSGGFTQSLHSSAAGESVESG